METLIFGSMISVTALLRACLGVGSFFRAPMIEAEPHAAAPHPVMVPIRSIGPRERDRVAQHLLALGLHDRYPRGG